MADFRVYPRNPLRTVEDYRGEILQNQAAQQAIAGNELAMQEKRNALAREAEWRGLAARGIDPRTSEGLRQYSAIDPMGAAKLGGEYANITQREASAKASEAKAEQDAVETRVKQFTLHFQKLAGVDPNNPQSVGAWIQAGIEQKAIEPDDAERMAELYTQAAQQPDGGLKWRDAIMKMGMSPQAQEQARQAAIADERIRSENEKNRAAQAEAQQMTDARIRSEGAANRAVQMRGQNLVDARTRELAAIRAEELQLGKIDKMQAKLGEDLDKRVSKYSDTLQKNGIPEFEEALSQLEGILAEYPEGKAPGIGVGVGLVPDFLQGAEAERLRQALSAVTNVLLKARSGAAVTESELRRFVQEVGTGGFRSEATVRAGIKRIRDRFEKVKEGVAAGVDDTVKSTYEDRGGVVIERGGKQQKDQSGVFISPYLDPEKEKRYQEWKAKQND